METHLLQRLAYPARSVSAIVHVLGLSSFSASFRYLRQVPSPMSHGFGGDFQYLTIIGLALATATFGIGFLADLTLSPWLFRIKNVFSVCSAPLEVLVSILYWGLCAINKNFGFHAMPAVMLTLDLILLSPPWTVKVYGAMSISVAVAFLYWGWLELCFTKNGWYPYPLLGLLTTWQRVVLFGFSAAMMAGSTIALKWVYGKVNGIGKFKRDA
ncbi:FAR-17a/AIG1-like protein [Lasiosphaeria miniovina]|uniref:FAR-17a/AIG1-like protein n=1 Tax=Lasiosphaeria miniovina TaxID=1954250 RepID=A0AA40DJM6_9PEZI|nr:FAR-17a/AIG1-like protein [Lasiosphaeria miniovina]KAK0703821.1 FAR-17a/AIG1-like protein [Lasiosphaeria miniovina]